MRWSLIISTSITVLSTLSVALVIPLSESSVDLERRAGDDGKASSKTYRKNAENHDYLYKFDQTGGVSREKLKLEDRPANGRKIIMVPNTDADHVFEHQMLKNHLAKHNVQYDQLDPKVKDKVKGVLNGPRNMAPVPRKINRGKGQTIKQGMKGKALKPNQDRDDYTLLSYGTARKTAKKLDKVFAKNGIDFKGDTLHKTLRNTMNNAKIMDPNDPSPKSSDHGSSKDSSNGSKTSSEKAPSDKAPSDKATSDKATSDAASSDQGSVKASPIRSPRRKPASFIAPVGNKNVMMLPIRRSGRLQGHAAPSSSLQ